MFITLLIIFHAYSSVWLSGRSSKADPVHDPRECREEANILSPVALGPDMLARSHADLHEFFGLRFI